MINTIIKASQNFCIHQIRMPYTVSNGISEKRTLIAYIDIEEQSGKKHRVYVASDINFMQRISTLFLDEVDSDEETLIDMALETVNLIVGSAKVIAEETQDNPYTIQTPHFLKIDNFDFIYDESRVIKIENDEMIIAIKEL
ncbi:chemotaxis protein CheX [Sulfurimonas sp.]|uniref:chemotaxis protein CheX n=1 Tax=Sulfurimonas sp. TaxID=2022749 RepID=UPI002B47334D|nr:chemotaxis protein CheX [Sulfurimonas sp.]